MDGFNPFDFLQNKVFFDPLHSLKNLQQIPGLEQYINNLLGNKFLSQVMSNQQAGFIKIEVFQTTDEVVVIAEIPELETENNVHISLKGLTLLLEATIPVQNMEAQFDGLGQSRQMNNRSSRKISRRVKLPYPVKSFGAKALYKNGILEIRLPKELLADDSHIEVQFL